jgi:hypothetical protein
MKSKDQVLLEECYRYVCEVFLDKQLFKPGGTGLKGIKKDLKKDAARLGRKVTSIKGFDIYIKQGNPHGHWLDKVSNVAVFDQNEKHILNFSLYPYGYKDTYREGVMERFNEGNIFASDIYHYLVTQLNWKIVSDDTHSRQGAEVWKRMMQQYPDIKFTYLGGEPRDWQPIDPKDTKQLDSLWSTTKPSSSLDNVSLKMEKG